MMCFVGNLVIANGETTSNTLANKTLKLARRLAFKTGALTGTVGIQVAHGSDDTPDSPLYDGTTAVTVPASKTTEYRVGGFGAMRAVSGGAEGAERTIAVYADLEYE